MVTNRDPIEIVPIPTTALIQPFNNEFDGPFRSCLPSCDYYQLENMPHKI